MSFADMTFRLVPLERRTRGNTAPPTLTLIGKAGKTEDLVQLYLNQSLRRALGIERRYELLLNGRAIAVRAAGPKAQHPRTVSTAGASTVTVFGRDVLRVRPGERWEMPATIEDDHAWTYLPDELVRRMKGGVA